MDSYGGRACGALLLVLGLTGTASAATQIKCWAGRDGVRECGNSVPSEFAQQGHSKFSTYGVKIGEQRRAKTIAELREEQWRTERKAEEDRRGEDEARADRVLLDTFDSEHDLMLARDGRIAVLAGEIQLMQGQIEKLQDHLDRMVSSAAALERQGQIPTAPMAADMDRIRAQIEQSRTFITTKREEQEVVRRKFDADIQRFRQLAAEP
ncbi:MAG: hypothetical protein ACT4QB_23150 [Gammaproteobacteria bacterium]